jgi:excisionase family DNA binding protein
LSKHSSYTEKAGLSIAETAARSGFGRDGIYRAIREGKLEAKKFGRRTIIPAASLERFMAELPSLRLPNP